MKFPALNNTKYKSLLSKSGIFKGLTAAQIDSLSQKCKIKSFENEEMIIKEGDFTRGLYTLLEGEIHVFLPKSQSPVKRLAQINLARLKSGVSIGEYSLIDDFPASASVQSVGRTQFSFLPQLNFEELLDTNERIGRIIYRNMLKSMVTRLRDNDKELDLLYHPG